MLVRRLDKQKTQSSGGAHMVDVKRVIVLGDIKHKVENPLPPSGDCGAKLPLFVGENLF